MNSHKISIIVPVYRTEKYLEKCLDSIINQTYTNIEVIIVNDCSDDNSQNIIGEYVQKDSRIKSVKNSQNLGLYATRLEGIKVATGEFVAFVDSDDFLSVDWFRRLIDRQNTTNADVVLGQHALLMDEKQEYKFEPMNQPEFDFLSGENLKLTFFKYLGLRYTWQVVWNKLYRLNLWKDNLRLLTSSLRINLWEDVVFNSIIFSKAESIASIEFVGYFYRRIRNQMTQQLSAINFRELKHNIKKELLTKLPDIYHKYIELFMKRDNDKGRFLYQCKFNLEYENLINKIVDPKYEYVSFDVFDTLVQRPLFEPRDLFELLATKYIELTEDSVLDFAVVREKSEFNARHSSSEEEISLDQIYDNIHSHYAISRDVLDKVKSYEIELELKLCVPRKSIQEVFNLANSINKKIIIISDMYLQKEVIEEILKKNGYSHYHKFFLSSELKQTKHSGNLFKRILAEIQCSPEHILHIGDNHHADFIMAKKSGIEGFFFPKAIDVFMGKHSELNVFHHYQYITDFMILHHGLRCMLATIAIKFFDNPFTVTYEHSHMGRNPYWLGYYHLGIFMLGITNWICKEAKHFSQINFIARDGYLLKNIYDKFSSEIYSDLPPSNYLELSRSVLYRSVIADRFGFLSACSRHFDKDRMPETVLPQLFGDNGRLLDGINTEYKDNYELVKEIDKFELKYPNLYDENKELSKNLRSYLDESVKNNSCFVDVGYARRSHMMIFNASKKIKEGFFIIEETQLTGKYGNSFPIRTYIDSSLNDWMKLKTSELEYIISDYKVGTVIGLENKDGKIYPKYKSLANDPLIEVDLVQKGARDFVDDFLRYFGSCFNGINFHNVSSYYFLQLFLDNLTEFDAQYFWDNSFDDEFSGLANNTSRDIFKVANIDINNARFLSMGVNIGGREIIKLIYKKYKDLTFKQKVRIVGKIVAKKLGCYNYAQKLYQYFR